MKIHNLYAASKLDSVKFDVSELPQKIGIVTTIQFLADMEKVKKFLEDSGKEAIVAGQVLGCDQTVAKNISEKVDTFLYVGTGEFHPSAVAWETMKPVYVLDPGSMKIRKIDDREASKIMLRQKGMRLKFHSSKIIGVLMTTKKGQSRVQITPEKVFGLEEKFPDKKFYYFICDTLDFNELENFPFIECWVNTMCPRIMQDLNVLNIKEVLHETDIK
ncbi:diphthamide synthesis protein [Nanoarchaeota archaeon]